MKWAGTSLPSGPLRCPVSIGWLISTRTSVKPLPSVARIFIGPAAMSVLLACSAAAAADGDLDFLRRGKVLAAGLGHHAHVRGLAHLDVELDERQRALHEVELGGEREGVLFDQH